MTLAYEDTNSILTDNAKRTIQGNVAMRVMQPGDQCKLCYWCNWCKWRLLVAKFAISACVAKFGTNAAMWSLNLRSYGVNFWVRCASGNIFNDVFRNKRSMTVDVQPFIQTIFTAQFCEHPCRVSPLDMYICNLHIVPFHIFDLCFKQNRIGVSFTPHFICSFQCCMPHDSSHT